MLTWIRGKRLDLKTTIIVLVVALLAWAVVVYVNLRDFVPSEFQALSDSAQADSARADSARSNGTR